MIDVIFKATNKVFSAFLVHVKLEGKGTVKDKSSLS